MKFYDISVPLSDGTTVYPGDPKVRMRQLKKTPSAITELTLGTHSGTHVDAPRHSFPNGKGIDEIPLQIFFGPCRVLDFSRVKQSISVADLQKHAIKKGERILVKTSNSRRGFKRFYSDYVFLSPEGAEYLAKKGIQLFGIDYFSVKQRGNPDNRAHTALLKKNIVIFETLNLQAVPAGAYTFVGFPLRIVRGDGSPARVVLIQK